MRILIWGTGATAKKIMENGIKGDVVGFVRSYPGMPVFLHKPVFLPHNIDIEYDYIFVATVAADAIYNIVQETGIGLDKVCFLQIPTALADSFKDNVEKGKRFLSDKNLLILTGCDGESKENDFILKDLERYSSLNTRDSFRYNEAYKYFIYSDKYADAGSTKPVFFQDVWAAKLVHDNNPQWHFDFGSRVDGFISHVLSFRNNIVRIERGSKETEIPDIDYINTDITNMKIIPDNSVESLSVMCSLDQFALENDKNSTVYFEIFAEIQKKIAPGGMAYLAIPVGMERKECGTHQIFAANTVIKAFSDMKLVEYSVANSSGIEHCVPVNRYDLYTEDDELLGLFCFRKKGKATECEIRKSFYNALKHSGNKPLGRYFYQDLWAARLINKRNPGRHFDIGSRVDGFIGHLLSFREQVTLIDIRPLPVQVKGIDFIQADATNLDGVDDDSIESISALCSLEHFGLGRYGDPVDPEACFRAFHAVQKKVAPGGFAYIAVPVGKERVEFNALRVFFAKTVVDEFSEMELVEFSVTDGNRIECDVPIDKYDSQLIIGNAICGLFCFKKRSNYTARKDALQDAEM